MRKTIAADGVGALWKGFGPAMARVSWRILLTQFVLTKPVQAFPANAATFLGVEASRKFLDGLF